MKKQKIGIILILLFVIMLTGCAIPNNTTPISVREVQVIYITDVGVSYVPVIADLEIGETKINGSFRGIGNIEELKASALSDALLKNRADVLIEPIYTFSDKRAGIRTISVTGFPGVYKNFRQATEQDAWIRASSKNPPAFLINE